MKLSRMTPFYYGRWYEHKTHPSYFYPVARNPINHKVFGYSVSALFQRPELMIPEKQKENVWKIFKPKLRKGVVTVKQTVPGKVRKFPAPQTNSEEGL